MAPFPASLPDHHPASRLARFLAAWRGTFRLARLMPHVLAGVLTVALVYPWISHPRQLALKQRWSRQLLATLGMRLEKVGAADTAQNPATHLTQATTQDTSTQAAWPAQGMLVANHISFLDIFVINAWMPAAFVAKDEVRHWPVFGWLSARTDTLFLQRGSRRAAHAAHNEVLAQLANGRLVAFFPEGTTSNGDAVHPFHSALFQSAIDAACPVTPLLLQYRDARHLQPSHAADFVGEMTLFSCLWSIATHPGLLAQLTCLPCIATDNSDRRHLAAHAHRAIAHHLKHQSEHQTEHETESGARPINPNPSA